MRKWLVVALVALVGAAAVVLWGLRPAGAGNQGAPDDRSQASARPSAPSPSPLPSPEPAMAAGGKLTFNKSFAGSLLDTSVWATCYPQTNAAEGCTNFGNAGEREWYLPSQDQVAGGALHLVAQGVPATGRAANGAPEEYLCRSGMVTTYSSFHFEYGYLQVVARIPSGDGLWPALWLAAADLRWPPEIDILEHWGRFTPRSTGVFFHRVGAAPLAARPATANLSVGWHTFALNWTPTRLVWLIDGRVVLSTEQDIPHQPMYFIADLADYGSPQSAARCSGTLLIRSVQVWRS